MDLSCLWKRVVCAKYGLKNDGLVWDGLELKSPSYFVKSINGLFEVSQCSYKIIKDGFQVVVGSGGNVRFWTEIKWDSIPLKLAFPRIYALASNKDGLVRDFGSFVDSKWIWDVSLRRPLFDWEFDQWRCFLLALDTICIRRDIPDALAWSFSSNGCFSVGSFRRCLESFGGQSSSVVCPFLWQGICPPKVEIFLWQMLKGRLLVRVVLSKFGLSNLTNFDCPLCGKMPETIDHLFCIVNGLGSYGGWLWDGGIYPHAAAQRLENGWKVGKAACSSLALDSIKFRVVWWFKNFGFGSNEDITILLLDVGGRCVDKKPVKIVKPCSWSPPVDNDLFFNVDGSARGNPGKAGIGGVLRDASGKTLCLFSDSIGIADSILAEIIAIHRAVMLISSNQLYSHRRITILSDSKSVVSWINGVGFGNLSHVKLVYDIRQSILHRKSISIAFTPRGSNALADSLAKNGAVSIGERLEWGA
ncbi:hypothetical protein LWI29_030312 [Acer saccharum]|uniref:RNase H type-1 domain-containing protein n=1 Tax=Acer saccharum TaxID=4024 RepID=A0AA39W912_ACESA|nr:hypothetical protein LWI29_030312 [Acer saccharum]